LHAARIWLWVIFGRLGDPLGASLIVRLQRGGTARGGLITGNATKGQAK
jgi:hypothetical protein